MRVCFFAKHPPIQGGVSMRSYRYAHFLAEHGHDVHVFTTADEVRSPYRMYMRPQDWDRCSARYEDGGSVTVHWTAPVDRSQTYIPMATPYVSKLTSLALLEAQKQPFDFVYSFYLEPFGVAGYLTSMVLGIPHVVKTAGSDAGRLWKHPQLRPLYDRVFKSADALIVGGVVAKAVQELGVPASRCYGERDFIKLSSVFAAEGPALDVESLLNEARAHEDYADLTWGAYRQDLNYLGLYGKLGKVKGSFSLLRAVKRLVDEGLPVGLLVMAHGAASVESEFRDLATALGIADRVCQIPFLPSWRVQEFSRRCVAICCLEQDFPITFHQPIIPREVLMSGVCLVGSTEVIKKLPSPQRLVHGYNCVAVSDVNDVGELSAGLRSVVAAPEAHRIIGKRGRAFALELEQRKRFQTVIIGRIIPKLFGDEGGAQAQPSSKRQGAPSLAALALASLPGSVRQAAGLGQALEGQDPRTVVDRLDSMGVDLASKEVVAAARSAVRLDAVWQEYRQARAQAAATADAATSCIYRLTPQPQPVDPWDCEGLAPVLLEHVRIEGFAHDANELLEGARAGVFPASVTARRSWVVFAWDFQHLEPVLLVTDQRSATLLALCDGTRTAIALAEKSAVDGKSVRAVLKRFFELGALGFRTVAVERDGAIPAATA